jgi:hypothetical protein
LGLAFKIGVLYLLQIDALVRCFIFFGFSAICRYGKQEAQNKRPIAERSGEGIMNAGTRDKEK